MCPLFLIVPTLAFSPTQANRAAVAISRATTVRLSIEAAPPPGFVWATFDEAVTPAAMAPVEPARLIVKKDVDAVSAEVVERVNRAAATAIAERGHFALAIPGGSILKMLATGVPPEWASKTTMVYVNHKAVAMDDASLATHAKASALFLDSWTGVNVLVMDGTSEAAAEATAYEAKMRALPSSVLPRDASGAPVFDMMLIGVGDDGHVGSLYPDRDEVLDTSSRWVLPVEMKVPGSITLSLPVMAGAKEVLIAAGGVSDKYPMGKSAAMQRGIEGNETPSSFPAVGLRAMATWVLDTAAASTLSADYAACFPE
uniref:Glucosamine/galactosamine-6-phosphate isomerase domain-containing protein n=1 Tax=Haptolina brevifila TaxID=156173 RepID=A0A7S2GQF1_9EUKA|mmetsp:Transcript_44391/g.88726  ORF Transcript_44391/g.88726 Transcript_44391/m.88726 type:complete len:314 (+) Transcript_44391:56-997(+)